MRSIRLPQIKTFFVDSIGEQKIDDEVNEYVGEIYAKTNNFPRIETNSKFISVICDEVIEIDIDVN